MYAQQMYSEMCYRNLSAVLYLNVPQSCLVLCAVESYQSSSAH